MKIKRKQNLSDIISSLVFLGIFFLPFNSYKGLGFLGEFSKDSCTIFFLLATILLGLKAAISGKIEIPLKNPIFQIVLLLISWIIISSMLNIFDIYGYYFKQTSGINRSIRQYIVLMISAIVFLITYYNVFVRYNPKELFFKIRKILFYSFVIVTIYGFLEVLVLKFNITSLIDILKLFNYLPFVDVYIDFRNFRISSITFETPALATYLFFIAGWMFSYIITEKGIKKYLPGLITIALTLFSGSRAGLLIIFLQAIAFGYFLLKKKKYQVYFIRILKYSFIVIALILLVKGRTVSTFIFEKATSFEIEDDTHAISNKSRFGIQYTLFQVFLTSPLHGVGLGQQAFVSKDLYPNWATDNNWEFRLKYLNEEDKSFPPGYNIYLRILAETGLIGFIIFILLLVSSLYVAHQISRDKKDENSIFAIVIFVSLIGVVFNWLKMDTFRLFNFWINLALLLALTKNRIKIFNKEIQE